MKISRRSAQPYEAAMALCPEARAEEFRRPLQLAGLKPGETLVDFPSGGGYLKPYIDELAAGVEYRPVEHVPGYKVNHRDMTGRSWTELPLEDGCCNVFFTLAAVHHYLEDRSTFFAECRRVLRPGGRMIIADVMEGTPAARFLDEVVGRYSSQGHTARFITPNSDELQSELGGGFSLTHFECTDLLWQFPDMECLLVFCKNLFRLDLVSTGELETLLEQSLGFVGLKDGIGLQWQLLLVRADCAGNL